jgi:hypothetical protein
VPTDFHRFADSLEMAGGKQVRNFLTVYRLIGMFYTDWLVSYAND